MYTCIYVTVNVLCSITSYIMILAYRNNTVDALKHIILGTE